jgi:hypothetical protein
VAVLTAFLLWPLAVLELTPRVLAHLTLALHHHLEGLAS